MSLSFIPTPFPFHSLPHTPAINKLFNISFTLIFLGKREHDVDNSFALCLFHFTVHSGNHFLSIQEILIHFQSYIALCVSVAWFIFPLSYMSI